jgi:hypothetical protein
LLLPPSRDRVVPNTILSSVRSRIEKVSGHV